MFNKFMILVSGPAGSGKTHWIKEHKLQDVTDWPLDEIEEAAKEINSRHPGSDVVFCLDCGWDPHCLNERDQSDWELTLIANGWQIIRMVPGFDIRSLRAIS